MSAEGPAAAAEAETAVWVFVPGSPDLPTLSASGLVLRLPREDDVAARLALGRDPDIQRMYGASRSEIAPLTEAGARRWVESIARHGHAWIIDAGGLVGHIRLDRIDARDRRASLAIGIDDPARLGKGIGTAALRLVRDYAFGPLGLHRLSLRVLADNERAIRAYRRCGFRIEGRERESALIDGHWHDDLIMGLLAHEVPEA